MNHEKKSSDIDQLKQVLAKSFDGGEADDVPPLPDGLRDRITGQYGRSATPSQNARTSTDTLFSRISQLFRTPAFAGAAAVLILLLVATVIINRPDSTRGLRGGDGHPSLTVVLYQLDEATRSAVIESDLDGNALTTAGSEPELAEALQATGARIVLDGAAHKILGYLPGQTEPHIEEPLPGDPTELANRIAAIQLKLTE